MPPPPASDACLNPRIHFRDLNEVGVQALGDTLSSSALLSTLCPLSRPSPPADLLHQDTLLRFKTLSQLPPAETPFQPSPAETLSQPSFRSETPGPRGAGLLALSCQSLCRCYLMGVMGKQG